ncbi:MAG: FapA family protein [Desulfobacterales bacterium]|nr:FapA family protein [Desulfobacterales bacterium]
MQKEEQTAKGSLPIRIALLLNYLTKSDFQQFCADIKSGKDTDLGITKTELLKKYMKQVDFTRLQRDCAIFGTEKSDKRFGELCIAFGFLTPLNLELALEEQRRLADLGQNIPLGTILMDAGMLAKGQRDLIIHKQKGFETTIDEQTDSRLSSGGNTGDARRKTAASKTSGSNSDPNDISRFREITEVGLLILIQNDGLRACLLKTRDFDPGIGVTGIRDLLEKNGIIYGTVDDDNLNSFIQNPKHKTIPFDVAKGIPPVDDTDGLLIYTFERDYLKPGLLSGDGSMDFRERGEIPYVKRGDILAEKLPPRPGKNGINVYGDTIHCRTGDDPNFRAGSGVRLSGDQLKAIADTDGNPKVNDLNEISVNDAYIIKGDVDFTTGHVKFDKNIFITGTIKSGFRVEGIDVVVTQVDGGSIKARGDVFVQGGMTESTVEAEGRVKAGYVHRSKISCMNDVTIAKEMVDSEAALEGEFDMPRGRLFSSAVTAKGGARIFKVGTEKTRPAAISVGISACLEAERKRIEKRVKKHMALVEDFSVKIRRTQTELAPLQQKLEDLQKARQRTLSFIKQMKKNPKHDPTLLQSNLGEAEDNIRLLEKEIGSLEVLLARYKRDAAFCSDTLKKSVQAKLKIKRLSQRRSPKPVLEILGTIMARTKVFGPQSHMIMEKTIGRSRIVELQAEGSAAAREMVVTPF